MGAITTNGQITSAYGWSFQTIAGSRSIKTNPSDEVSF